MKKRHLWFVNPSTRIKEHATLASTSSSSQSRHKAFLALIQNQEMLSQQNVSSLHRNGLNSPVQ